MFLHVLLALLICTSAAFAQDQLVISKMSLPEGTQAVQEILIDDHGATVSTETGIYRRQIGGEWVKVFPEVGFKPVRMFASPDLKLIYIVDGGIHTKGAMTWVTQDTFTTFVLDTLGNWRRRFSEVMIDRDHNIYSIDRLGDPQLVRKQPFGDLVPTMKGLPVSYLFLEAASPIGSYLSSWTDEGQRVAVCFRASVETAWEEIFVRTGNPASFVGVGQGRSKPAVIADAVGAMEFDGLTTKEFFRPQELQSPNGALHRVAVSNTDHVWFFARIQSSWVVYSSADRVKWDTAHGIYADVVKAFGDSVLLISKDGITVLKFRQAQGKVPRADETELTISTNPAKDVLVVSALPERALSVQVSIYDEAGRIVRKSEERVTAGSMKIDVRGIDVGSYLLKVETGQETLTSKFIIKD